MVSTTNGPSCTLIISTHIFDEFSVDKKGIAPQDECIYLCGQSLGLMPVRTIQQTVAFLNDWATLYVLALIEKPGEHFFCFDRGVYGHFTGSNPWATCDNPCIPTMCSLVGGEENEVAVMNQLSVNLHIMMVSRA